MHFRIIIIAIAVLLFTSPVFARKAPDRPGYTLNVSFDIPNSKIMGRAEIPVQAGKKITLFTGGLSISRVSLAGKSVKSELREGMLIAEPSENGTLEIAYEGVFRGGETSGGTNYGVTSSTIDTRGISLTGTWYPQPDFLSVYTLRAVVPRGHIAVSEAENVTKTDTGGGTEFVFEFSHPVDGINLVASNRYEMVTDAYGTVELAAYFFPEDRRLAETYLGYAKKYLELYEKILTPYPYRRFAVVENFLPTGYSMPTYTVLGQDVVRLPFIVETSLGHEILHQWFGNLVYIDAETGNWAEGLTTYLADHLYEEQQGRGWQYRKQILIDYASYVNENNEFALREFRSRVDFASKSIGYGKAAMVFHMLKNMIGEDDFYRMLRNILQEKKFQRVSWGDFERESERIAQKKLRWFFKQWVEEKGLPSLVLENPELLQSGDKYEVRFRIVQKPNAYRLALPVTDHYLQGGNKTQVLDLEKETETYNGLLDTMPGRISVDENYDIARRLTPKELPPVIARLLGEEKPLLVLPVNMRDAYPEIIEAFKKRGAVGREAGEVGNSEMKSGSLIILGIDNPLIGKLFGSVSLPRKGFSIILKENPWNPEKVVAIIHAESRAEADQAFPKIFHYGKYSLLSFERGRNVSKKTVETERGITEMLREEPMAIDLTSPRTLTGVIREAETKKIVYVGEYHDRVSHHNVQLQVVQALFRKNANVAIGMEMFQRPFQKVLDEYIAGTIDEREFLMRSEYFKRWGFDYNLYKPIVDFCRANKIPIVALNIRREIVDKVAKKGLDALTEEEKKEIPEEMDFSDNEYRERLKAVYRKHAGSSTEKFDFFYQAQILWDETMSRSLDEFLRKNPDKQMVVIAGGGHMAYGSGIPKRTFRRNGYDYTIILNDADVEQNVAHSIVFPKPLEGITAPKLNAMFEEENGRLSIAALSEDSVSKKAGLKVGDILISLDDTEVKNVEDVKLILFFKKKSEILKVKVLRKRLFLGDKEMIIEVKLEK